MGIRSDESRTKFYDAHARTNLTSSYVYKQNVINKEIGENARKVSFFSNNDNSRRSSRTTRWTDRARTPPTTRQVSFISTQVRTKIVRINPTRPIFSRSAIHRRHPRRRRGSNRRITAVPSRNFTEEAPETIRRTTEDTTDGQGATAP
jgi:predicted GTPase